jgi:hypothetical protein
MELISHISINSYQEVFQSPQQASRAFDDIRNVAGWKSHTKAESFFRSGFGNQSTFMIDG